VTVTILKKIGGVAEMVTLANILDKHLSNKTSIIIPNGPTINYLKLHSEIERVAEILAGAGIKKGRAVSIVLGNNLEFMILFLAVTRAGAIAAPLNPAYTIDEFKFYMEDTDAQLVLISNQSDFAIKAANDLNIEIATITLTEAGSIEIYKNGNILTTRKDVEPPNENDVALFLHTSGTTNKPKGVPLTHRNLISSLSNISKTYSLSESDIALVVMPLFHVHGLIGVALTSLYSGGVIVIPDRFSASTFWQMQSTHSATWYSAVPTIHQILLMRANDDKAPSKSFRLIRSCSAALAPSVFDQLENRFGAPVLEAYGMTEASHQMSSNLLPPGTRTPGTVGIGTGVQIAIMGDKGILLPPLSIGEVVIKGSNVTNGYHNNNTANTEAFTDGWFRTGDQGKLSMQNILTLTGRLKELINRGGEKISPLEIDSTLIRHPAVSEAVCFGIPDEKYGEIVQAAVVLSKEANESDIIKFCSKHIANFKIPTRIHIVDELPRTATGKIQRRHIAAKFIIKD
jgi:acyl-CoA synthetase (AMP-forming)/AMP-acid ligase II